MALLLTGVGWTILTLLIAPALLTVGDWQVRRPRTALTLWHLALGSGVLAAGVALFGGAALVLAAADSLAPAPVVLTVALVLSAGTGLGVTIQLMRVSRPVLDAHAGLHRRALALVHDRTRCSDGVVLARVDTELPIACAVPGREQTVLITSGLEAALSPTQLVAVIEHERAHLRGRHGWAVRIAAVNCALLPAFGPARRLRRQSTLLIELIADDSAARRVGAVTLAHALRRLAPLDDCAPEAGQSMLLRAARLERLWDLRPAAPQRRRLADLVVVRGLDRSRPTEIR